MFYEIVCYLQTIIQEEDTQPLSGMFLFYQSQSTHDV